MHGEGYSFSFSPDRSLFQKGRQNVSGEDFDRATETVGMQNLIAQEFHDWRMMRKKEYGEGKKKNRDKVTSADLLSDWEDWLE